MIVFLENRRCYSTSAKGKELILYVFSGVFLRFVNNLSINIFLSFFSFLFFQIDVIIKIKLQIFGSFESIGWSCGIEGWSLLLFFLSFNFIIHSNRVCTITYMTISLFGSKWLNLLRLISGKGTRANVNILDGQLESVLNLFA